MLHIYSRATAYLHSLQRDDRGATAVEYALLVGLVAVVLVGAVALFQEPLTTFVSGVDFGG